MRTGQQRYLTWAFHAQPELLSPPTSNTEGRNHAPRVPRTVTGQDFDSDSEKGQELSNNAENIMEG